MSDDEKRSPAGAATPRRVFYFNAGFLRQRRVRRMLELAGYPLQIGKPSADDLIAVWGHSPYAKRGEAVAESTGAGIIRVEDAFLRSVHPGREGTPPLGLVIDQTGVHFDSSQPSDLEHLLATHPLDDTALMDRARGAIAYLQEAHLSKYNAFDPTTPCPDPGYVLVIDQTKGDASVIHGQADANTFREMLYYAQEDHPGAKVLIKTHPETADGNRPGYFGPQDASDRIELLADRVSPWALFDGAVAVYTVSSQMGFEAIFAGHRPQVFGQPFYAGWNLTEDRHPVSLARRGRPLSRAQLFAAAMILYPTWYDPHRDCLCEIEDALAILEAQVRCWREDRQGWSAHGMRLWKRRPLQRFFGQHGRVIFHNSGTPAKDKRIMAWASQIERAPPAALRIEDGFLRSRGLGAKLVPPLSLVCDDLGIYYDPSSPSRLEEWIAKRATLRPDQEIRAERLISSIIRLGLSKYNLGKGVADLPVGHRILVPGQVEDDASIRLGAGTVSTNQALLERVRAENPESIILYKPHPDVEAGLRAGKIDPAEMAELADFVLDHADPAALLQQVDEVWTMTSLMGFEALIRGVAVTTTGAPFYAGWALTRDVGVVPGRRTAKPSLTGLVHAALIDYPRYFDPLTGTACSVETAIDRLASGAVPHPGAANRILSKLQGIFASYSGIWR
ncbi:capsular polysaccharide biosynthesis protein [uncultured Roseovarius sp.]|uniref:capsular polysaccharide biosynthesis protein n=1 Tax=uncultured Roseovarius sp. TaxID=293344 RepID=UPI002602BDF4|nr:capsular polysaccharide biosynthesis protein [uncultured Roseovarius sp.]